MRKYKRQVSDPYKYTLANVNLREENSASSKVLTVIPAGSKVQVMDAAEDWYEVLYNNQKVMFILPIYPLQNIPGEIHF